MIPCGSGEKRCLRKLMATHQLPVLPPNAPYLLKALSSEELSFRELASAVEQFPSIAARLVSLANSSWSSPVSEVTSVEMACARLGFSVVRSVAVALSVANVFNPNLCPAFDPVRYWCHAFLTADLGAFLAENEGSTDPQTVRTASLLHNLGLLWLATWMPEETHEGLRAWEEEPTRPLDAVLAEHCGTGCIEAGALLSEAWKFPAVLTDAIRHQAEPAYQEDHWVEAALVGLAGTWAHEHETDEEAPPAQDPRWIRLALSSELESMMLERLQRQREETRELAKTLFSH